MKTFRKLDDKIREHAEKADAEFITDAIGQPFVTFSPVNLERFAQQIRAEALEEAAIRCSSKGEVNG